MTDNQRNVNTRDALGFNSLIPVVVVMIIPIIIAILYFLGASYYNEWLEFWGVGSGLFPIDSSTALYYGSHVLAIFVFTQVVYVVLGLAMLTVAAVISMPLIKRVNLVRSRFWKEKKTSIQDTNKSERYKKLQEKSDRNFVLLGNIILGNLLVIVMTIAFGLAILFLDPTARRLAHNTVVNVKNNYDAILKNETGENNTFSKIETFKLKGRKDVVTGIVITCSAVVCALYLGEGKRTIFKVSDIEGNMNQFIPASKTKD